MTAKKKAEQIYYSMLQLQTIELSLYGNREQRAKQCALIAVEEIIEYINTVWFKPEEVTDNNFNYWQEVKNEIERL